MSSSEYDFDPNTENYPPQGVITATIESGNSSDPITLKFHQCHSQPTLSCTTRKIRFEIDGEEASCGCSKQPNVLQSGDIVPNMAQ